ncbi:MAG: hypothetical protein WBH05_12830 [Syntrophobacteria bacterium]
MVAHRLGQDEAYFTVREILAEASTAADGFLSRERSGFYRCRYTTLGLSAVLEEDTRRGRRAAFWCLFDLGGWGAHGDFWRGRVIRL